MDVSLNVNVFRRYLDYTKRKKTALERTLDPYEVQNMSETFVFHVFVLAWLIKVTVCQKIDVIVDVKKGHTPRVGEMLHGFLQPSPQSWMSGKE